MAWRGLVVLAIVAALLGAPPVASAAANALGSPSATPTTGTAETVFTLRVSYDGQFPATGVTAVVETRILAMSLVAGSASSGTWSAATTLPPGTWPVVYTAAVHQGNVPSLSGLSLTVYAATPAPSPVATVASNPPRTGAGGEAPASGGGRSTPAPPPAQAPAAGTPPTTPDAALAPPTATEERGPSHDGEAAPEEPIAPAHSSTPAPASADGAQSEAETIGDPTGTPAGAPGTGGATGTAEPPRDGVMAGTEASGPADEAAGPASADDDLLGMVLLLGLTGVAAVALAGSALLVMGRRRRTADVPALTAEAADPTADIEPVVMARRARRFARAARLDDDPILTSLGIGSDRAGRIRPAGKPDSERAQTKDGF